MRAGTIIPGAHKVMVSTFAERKLDRDVNNKDLATEKTAGSLWRNCSETPRLWTLPPC